MRASLSHWNLRDWRRTEHENFIHSARERREGAVLYGLSKVRIWVSRLVHLYHA